MCNLFIFYAKPRTKTNVNIGNSDNAYLNTLQVAGITLTKEASPLLSISGKPMVSEIPIKLGIKSISDLETYGNGEEDVKLSILFHDGNTCVKGIAFGAAARKWKKTLKASCTYKVCSYEIRKSNRKFENTKFEIHLKENTCIKKLKNGYAEIPEETKMKIAELDNKFENLLVSTSKVKITKIKPLKRPKERFLRVIYISDATGEIKIKIWSREEEEFPYNEGEFVKLKYVYLKFDRKCKKWYLGQSDNMLICQCY